jgi:hypothetical protein
MLIFIYRALRPNKKKQIQEDAVPKKQNRRRRKQQYKMVGQFLPEELSPVLAGFTVGELWPTTSLILPAWLLLFTVPRWRYTKVLTLVPPLVHSAIYASIIIPLMIASDEPADFNSLEGVYKMFRDPNVVFVGWIHYLAFDLLVARGISMDAIERGATNMFYYFLVVPCLFLTLMLGPTGFLLYSIIRTIALPATIDPPAPITAPNVKSSDERTKAKTY